MKRFSHVFLLLAAVALALSVSPSAEAKQHLARLHGREVVVHTNPVPVFLHRLVPPNHGRHVTVQEYRSGRVQAWGR